jgi:xanthine dehydrogenase YagS FAD-binding subunit
MLASAILAGASQQLRNMASTGGNLLQQTRAGQRLLRHPGHEPHPRDPRRERGLHCHYPSDMCVALAALDAKVHVTGPAGERTIAFSEFLPIVTGVHPRP